MNEELSENLYEALLLRADLAESAESQFLRDAHVKAAEEIYAQLIAQRERYSPTELSRAERTMQFLLEVEAAPIVAQTEKPLPEEPQTAINSPDFSSF